MKILKNNTIIALYVICLFALSFAWNWPWESDYKNNIKINLKKGNYLINKEDSIVKWKGQKVVGSAHVGDIQIKDANIEIDEKGNMIGNVIIDMKTINCTDLEGDWKYNLEGHLKSDDFFGVDKYNYSEIKFKSIKQNESKINFDADLTIKGITHPIIFDADFIDAKDKIIANSNITFDRAKYNVKYGSGSFFDNLGDNMISDYIDMEVVIVINK